MATSKKLNGTKSSDQTLSAAVTRVSLSVRQENGEVTKTRVTCGRGYDTPLANYDPDTQSWKMCADISLWEEPTYLATLPASGMTRNGVLYQQPAWEPIIGETASSSWPTPLASDSHYRVKGNSQSSRNLQAMAIRGELAMWPTPTTQEVEHPEAELTETGRRKSKNGTTSHSLGLADMVQRWPTPTADEAKNAYSTTSAYTNLRTMVGASPQTGKLNPTWVEWLMGFPTGWTDLED